MGFQNVIEARTELLKRVMKDIERELPRLPKGLLRTSIHRDGIQYYCKKKGENNGTYLRQDQLKTAQGLAQREYDEKLLLEVRGELKLLEKLSGLSEEPWFEVQKRMPEAKRLLVESPVPTREEILKAWKSEDYTRLGFREGAPELYTLSGIRMRSKSEVMMGNMFDQDNIPYKYEKSLWLGTREVWPDFTFLDVEEKQEIFLEHLGMLDDPEYLHKAIIKLLEYEENGIYLGGRLLVTYETSKIPLNIKHVRQMIHHYLG